VRSDHRRSIGLRGEDIAADYLKRKGYSVLNRNFRTPYGEIDLVSEQGNSIVFTEVKTRASKSLGPPEISITRRKADHMRSAAEFYIQEYGEQYDEWRIDVISVQIQTNETPLIVHFENAITG
jgi:putative endonuclease